MNAGRGADWAGTVRRLAAAALLFCATLANAAPTAYPPGYVDPAPILARATAAIGADRFHCLRAEGTAYGGRVGQQRYVKVEDDWPIDKLTNYARTMNWDARAMREEFDRKPGETPASYKYGVGWMGGTPLQRESRQMFAVNGRTGWHRDGQGIPGPIDPAIAEQWQLDLWMNPVGFLKAAALPGADPIASWRWELGESGRDGPTTVPKKVHVVSIRVMGRYRIDATINEKNLIQRLHSRFADPVLGDMNFEHEFFDEAYADLGGGMRFPTYWHSHQGYDDNYNTQTISSGHNGFGGSLPKLTVNQCADRVTVPPELSAPPDYARIETRQLAPDVWLIGGAPQNSVAIGFRDWVVVVEAPINETRSLAVIEAVAKLFPGKPIRYLVNTHQHFDSIGGIRSYAHIGATIVTHARNHAFYNRDVINYAPRMMAPDLVSIMPPTELTEGYNYELVRENYTITDGKRLLHLNYVQPLQHAEGMLMAVLPAEGIVIQSDLVNTFEGLPTSATDGARALYAMVRTLNYPVTQIVPIQGPPVGWQDFVAASGVDRPAPRPSEP
jgi:glyoxylase-like metal-dependent hydrolase (beta-lactamase superfamily II)